MNTVTLQGPLPVELQEVKQPVRVRDASGRLLGSFVPALDLSQYGPWEPVLDEAEIQRMEQAKKGKRYTTAEVLRHLESL
jgi:hypothetical protein